jgi:hypothetical protein
MGFNVQESSMTELDKETERLADEIVNEFQRLKVSTDNDPCSGLMTRVPNVVMEIPIVDIYDDYVSGFYDARQVLTYLKQMNPEDTSLLSEDTNNIWQHLSEFEA